MKAQKRISIRRRRRGFRVHNRVRRDRSGRARLSVFRSNKHIYAQVIDDASGQTLVSASTTESDGPGGNCKAAQAVGQRVAERAIDWEELKKSVPPGTPKPPEELLQPGSVVFASTDGPVPLSDERQWWEWTTGADR